MANEPTSGIDFPKFCDRERARLTSPTRLCQSTCSPSYDVRRQTAQRSHSDALLAEILVEQETLTKYQADQLSIGRTKLTLGPTSSPTGSGRGDGASLQSRPSIHGRVCAVKVLMGANKTDESRLSFIREIRMQAKLDCEYLVRAYDAGQDKAVHYLVTEYVPGMDLRRLVKATEPLPLHQAASIVRQAALGLDYAHRMGLVHRDVKPGNILVTPDGIAKVSDIGLAGFVAD